MLTISFTDFLIDMYAYKQKIITKSVFTMFRQVCPQNAYKVGKAEKCQQKVGWCAPGFNIAVLALLMQ